MSTAIKTKFLVSHLLVNSNEQHLRILVNSTQLSYSWEPCPAEPVETQVQPDLTVWSCLSYSLLPILSGLFRTSFFVWLLETLLPSRFDSLRYGRSMS